MAEDLDDILLDQLLAGNWSAVDRMTAQVKEEQGNSEELMEQMEEILNKPKEGRPEDGYWQDREAIEAIKRQFRELEIKTHDRQLQRQEGISHQLHKLKGNWKKKKKRWAI